MRKGSEPTCFPVALQFHGDLPLFLKRRDSAGRIERILCEKTSVKDVIEACGVPHTEVDLIVCNGQPVGFEFHVALSSDIEVFPVSAAIRVDPEHRLQRRQRSRFVADGHLGKLARDLRLLGFDVLYDKEADDSALVRIAADGDRTLLTRDRRLLMHAAVRDGYCPRSDRAEEQIIEVVRRFALAGLMLPYTRCLACNGRLAIVSKQEVVEELEPLTKLYYEEFRQCESCRRVFWPGSHFAKLQARLDRIRSAVGAP